MTDEAVHAWDELRSAGMVHALAAGEWLFREGDDADGAYVVLVGRCAVLEGDQQVNVLEAGELFGEVGAISGGVRTAGVVTIEPSEFLFLSTVQLREGMAASPELLWRSLRLIVSRLRTITARQVAYRDEHKALREVQRSLLPDLSQVETGTMRVEAVWEPSTFASGDYYDVIALDHHRHLIVIGDVMGHGAESSLTMAIARAQLHEAARTFRRTDELLLNLDGYLRDNAPPRKGMSMVAAVFDQRERVLEYSVAGHPFPLLVHGDEIGDLPGRPGIILGLPFMLGTGYERREVELEPGDRLLMFTDGLFEVPIDADEAQLGRDGLIELVRRALGQSEHPALEHLLRLVAETSTLEVADDDRTALLIAVS